MRNSLSRPNKLWSYTRTLRFLVDKRSTTPTPAPGAGGSGYVAAAAMLAAGAGLAQVLSVAAAPLLSRLYTPADFGLLAWFSSTAAIVATLVTGRYETAVLPPKKDSEAAKVVQLALLCAAGGVVIIATITSVAPDILYDKLKLGALAAWLPLGAVYGGLIATFAVLSAWHNRRGAYRLLSISRVGQSGLAIALAIILGFTGIASGQVWSNLLAAAVIVMVLAWREPYAYSSAPLSDLIGVAYRHAAAPKYLLPSALLGTATQQLPVYLIAAWFSTPLAGQFSIAWQILVLPIRLVGDAVSPVFFQRFAQAWPDYRSCRRLLYFTWATLAGIGALPTIIIMIWGPELFSFVFGRPWYDAGSMATLLAPLAYVTFISSPTSTNAVVMGLQKLCLYIDVVLALWRCVAFMIASQFGLQVGLIAWVWGEIALILIRNLVVLRPLYR